MTSSVNRINYSINQCWFIRIRNLYEHFLWDSLCFSILMKSNTSNIWKIWTKFISLELEKKKHTIHNIPSHLKWIFHAHFLFVLVNWKNIVTNVHSCVVFFCFTEETAIATPVAVYKFHNYSTQWFDRVSSVVSHSS